MLLTIRTTYRPATDLGFLLHKHPEHVHTREFPFGNTTESSETRRTADRHVLVLCAALSAGRETMADRVDIEQNSGRARSSVASG